MKVEGKVVEETDALDLPLLSVSVSVSVSLPFDISNRVLYVSSCARGGGLLVFVNSQSEMEKACFSLRIRF